MNGINLTIYLVDDVVSGPIYTFQVVYLDSNTLITIGCQPAESPSIDNLAESCVYPIWQEKIIWYLALHFRLPPCIW